MSLISKHRSPRVERRRNQTNIKMIARGAAFLGLLLLLFAIASGLNLHSAGGVADPAALQQHSIIGMVGTGLCAASLILLLRVKS